ncbi:hypothetical protein ABPG77_000594 [Micractinium sp. CCAP 211/92]
MLGRGPLGALAVILALLQIGAAVAIAVVVRQGLWTIVGGWHWAPSWWSHTSGQNVCLMTPGGANLCAFAYVVVAVGLAASTAAMLTQCFSRGGRGSGRCCAALDLCIATLAAPWWLVAAVIATVYGVRADQAGVPHQGARTAVWSLAWVLTGLWLLSALVAVATHRACRGLSETELSASLAGGSRYARYNDTPFNDRASKWREAKAAYLSSRSLGQGAPQKQVDP